MTSVLTQFIKWSFNFKPEKSAVKYASFHELPHLIFMSTLRSHVVAEDEVEKPET